jgi:hypothetical protein
MSGQHPSQRVEASRSGIDRSDMENDIALRSRRARVPRRVVAVPVHVPRECRGNQNGTTTFAQTLIPSGRLRAANSFSTLRSTPTLPYW